MSISELLFSVNLPKKPCRLFWGVFYCAGMVPVNLRGLQPRMAPGKPHRFRFSRKMTKMAAAHTPKNAVHRVFWILLKWINWLKSFTVLTFSESPVAAGW